MLKKTKISEITPTMSKAEISDITSATKAQMKHFKDYRNKKRRRGGCYLIENLVSVFFVILAVLVHYLSAGRGSHKE
jgi:hypothetical protein